MLKKIIISTFVIGILGTVAVVEVSAHNVDNKNVTFTNTSSTKPIKQPSNSNIVTEAPVATPSSTSTNTLSQQVAQDQLLAQQDAQYGQSRSQQSQNSYSDTAPTTYTTPVTTNLDTVVNAPSSALFAWTSGPGNLNGTYYYAVSYVTSGGTESSLSSPSLSVSPNNQEVEVSNIPTSSNSTVTERNLYRTKANSSMAGPFYLVTTIYDNSTTSYIYNTPDSNLYQLAP